MLSKYSKINLSRYCTLRQLPTNELEGVLQNGESTLYVNEDGSLCIISKDNDNVTIQRLLNQINNVKIPEFNLPDFIDEYTAYALSAVKNGTGYDLTWAKIPTSLEYNPGASSLPPITALTKYRTIATDNLQKINITNQSLLNTLNSYDLNILLNEDESIIHKNTSGDFSLSQKTLTGITTNIFKNNLINEITPPSFPSTQLTGNNVYCLSAKTISGSTTMDWLLVNAKLNYNTGNTISVNEIVDIVDVSKTKINLSRQTNLNISGLTNNDIIEILKKRNDYNEFILHKNNDELILSNKIYGTDFIGEYYTINNITISNDKIYGKNIPAFEQSTEEDYILVFIYTDNTFTSNTLNDWELTWIPATPKLSYYFDFTNNTVSGGTIDNTFNIGSGFTGGTFSYVEAIALQTDNKILIGGQFNKYNGLSNNGIVRLNTSGTIDNTFTTGVTFDNGVTSIDILNNEIFIAANYTTYNSVFGNYVFKLNNNGTINNSFNVGLFDDEIRVIKMQSDGKILVGGNFTTYSGTTRNRIIRLNSDGTIDNTFTIGSGFSDIVYAITTQSDNKILVGGLFTSYSGVTRNNIIRLNSDGTIDNTFTIGAGFSGGFPIGYTYTITQQSDNKILVGGLFTSYSGVTSNYIIRLNSDGTIDPTFNIGTGFNAIVYDILTQRDNKILVIGDFTSYNSTTRNRIIRLNSDGTIDNTFTIGTGFNPTPLIMGIQPDGKILVGGDFTTYDGTTRNRIIRLNNNKIAALNIFVNNNLVETKSTTGGGNINIKNGDSFYSEIVLGTYLSTAQLDMIIDGNTSPYAEEILIINPTGTTTSSTFTAENSRRYFIQSFAT